MRYSVRCASVLGSAVAAVLLGGSVVHAGNVLALVQDTDPTYEADISAALPDQTVTFANESSYTGSFAGYNAVVLSTWATHGNDPFASTDEETALVNFVQGGGGLVTGEWTNWNVADHFDDPLQTGIEPVLPVVPSTNYDYNSPLTYTAATPDPILDKGVPTTFSFTADDAGGTETYFQPKAGAVAYFATTAGSNLEPTDALIGAGFGTGRSISFSTLLGPTELTTPAYSTLFDNAVDWSEKGDSVEHFAICYRRPPERSRPRRRRRIYVM